jgi:hypothetical protein
MLALRWDRPGTGGHNDVALRLDAWTHRFDSYYLALDQGIAGSGVSHVAAAMQARLSSKDSACDCLLDDYRRA